MKQHTKSGLYSILFGILLLGLSLWLYFTDALDTWALIVGLLGSIVCFISGAIKLCDKKEDKEED